MSRIRGVLAAAVLRSGLLTLLVLQLRPMRAPAASSRASSSGGDCNGDGSVTVDDLLKLANIALGSGLASDCAEADVNSDGHITVDEIQAAINAALAGPVAPTPTPVSAAVEHGLEQLQVGDLGAALDAFRSADPSDDAANLYAVFVRLATVLLDDARLRDLATRAGVSVSGNSHDICNFAITLPDQLLSDAPGTGEIMDTARTVLLPELETALTTLNGVSDNVAVAFSLDNLPNCVRDEIGDTDLTTVGVDRSDLALIVAGFHAAVAGFETVTAYNVDVPMQALLDGLPRSAVDKAPDLLKLRFADRLTTARDRFGQGFASLIHAFDLMGSGDRTGHLKEILLGGGDNFRKASALLRIVQQSFDGEVALPIDVVTGDIVLMDIGLLEQEHLNLSLLFSGSFPTLRIFLPAFDDKGEFDTTQFPDPTFGGSLPTMTQDKIDSFLVGPACQACETDEDCDPLGLGDFYCLQCSFNCTGTGMRCGDGFQECVDGVY